jgi:hypothetical protein
MNSNCNKENIQIFIMSKKFNIFKQNEEKMIKILID